MKIGLVLGLLVAAGLWTYAALPFPRPHASGVYTFAGWTWCETEAACIHELGHRLDDEAGWISQSPEFITALEEYTPVRTRRNGQPDSYELKELYAAFYAEALTEDKMPPQFREFFDWGRASELEARYRQAWADCKSSVWIYWTTYPDRLFMDCSE